MVSCSFFFFFFFKVFFLTFFFDDFLLNCELVDICGISSHSLPPVFVRCIACAKLLLYYAFCLATCSLENHGLTYILHARTLPLSPQVLRTFSLRRGSGGRGAFPGGDGVVRSVQFRKPSVLSILSERRSFSPYGMAGGGPGARGVNTLFRTSKQDGGPGEVLGLGGKNTLDVYPGDIIRVESPGGGGYGFPHPRVSEPHFESAADSLHSEGKAGQQQQQQRFKLRQQEEEQAEEYTAALQRAGHLDAFSSGGEDSEGGPTAATTRPSTTAATAIGGGSGSGAGRSSAPMEFTGSVGRYRETQETN